VQTEWSSFYAPGSEIRAYLEGVVNKHRLRPHIKLQHELLRAQWDGATGQWRLRVRRTTAILHDELDDVADVLLVCTGALNRWSWPTIKGLHDFQGTLLHSAQRTGWAEARVNEWKDKTVGVIGVVCSSRSSRRAVWADDGMLWYRVHRLCRLCRHCSRRSKR